MGEIDLERGGPGMMQAGDYITDTGADDLFDLTLAVDPYQYGVLIRILPGAARESGTWQATKQLS
ncbi:hypothetical protein N7540_007748 [Penicillium herquei]|nr:hypothetical protein N7540_007748 [Penicillium herquei]